MPPLRNSGGVFGFAVGADDLGGPRAHTVRPYGGNGPGALARGRQAQKWSRTRSNFPQTQGPVARREFRTSLKFCAPEMFCLLQGVTPVNGVRGKRSYGHEVPVGRVPGGVLPNPSLLPAKPSEAGSPGRGGARERTQFSPPGGNGVEWTQGELARRDKRRWPGPLRRRAAAGKVTRRPQAAKYPAQSLQERRRTGS